MGIYRKGNIGKTMDGKTNGSGRGKKKRGG